MAITFNHTIVAARDREESATFFTDLFGLPTAKEFGPFLAVELNHGASLDYAQVGEGEEIRPQHYALLVSEEDELRQSATEIIRKIGKPAVEPLATALAEADDRLKTRVLKVLDRMGYKPKAKEAVKTEAPRLT